MNSPDNSLDQIALPSARMVWPLTRRPSGPTRNETTEAMSSGRPSQPNGFSFAISRARLPLREKVVTSGPALSLQWA